MDVPPISKKTIFGHFFKTADYISHIIAIFICYVAVLLIDELLFYLVWLFLKDVIREYPIVKYLYDYFRIGTAILIIMLAFTHAILSTISLIKTDLTS
jgi:hypothetical protein